MKKRLISFAGFILCVSAFPLFSKADISSRLILNYEFKDTTGSTTITDSSPEGNDGTIKGSGASIADGVLTLPGGASGSSAGYVQLPTGMFDNQDTLTISVWLKNETGSGNYAAMFFGTTESKPVQYWLLNPANPSGLLKSVITNSNNTSSPWTTEYGFSPSTSSQGIAGPTTDSNWGLYTTVITPTMIRVYYNGTKIGDVAITRKVSDFGTNLVAYIGRSSYSDKFYQGKIKRVKIYDTVLSDKDVKNEYYAGLGSEATLAALNDDIDAISFPETEIINDLTLPDSGGNGSVITWASSDIAYISENGHVTRSNSNDRKVLLTATCELGGQTVTKSFVIKILANTPEKNLQYIINQLDLGISYVTEDITLPTIDGYSVSWKSSNSALLDSDGKVSRPAVGAGDQEVVLTATVSEGDLSVSKEFKVTVAEEDYAYLMSYIQTGSTTRTNSLFIANSQDESTYTALNNGKAIVYPLLGTKKFRLPWLFRKPDGTFGLIATDNNQNGVIVFHSPDLINYTDENYLVLNNSITIQNFICSYDNAKLAYGIKWQASDGKYYESITKDFITIDSTFEISAFLRPVVNATSYPTGALDRSTISLTKSEYDKVVTKYAEITNTGIAALANVEIQKSGQLSLPDRVTAQYSDGSSKQLGVIWDETSMNSIDVNTPGTYTVNGVVQQPEYSTPLIEQRADPYITKGDDGYYYFTASYPMTSSSDAEGYDRVILRRATTIEGLATADEVTIWDEKNTTSAYRYVWAPEIHKINGTWYVFFTASTSSSSVWTIRPRVIVCNQGEKDPMTASCWETSGHLMEPVANDNISFTAFSLDMTHFENNGTHYIAWAQAINGYSSIAIASVDPQQPWVLTSPYTLLTAPAYAWEKDADQVDEGPAVIKHDGKVYVAFSASSVNSTYCVGLMYADENSDLLNTDSWTKVRYPLLTTDDLPDTQSGPGHNSFTVDEYGNPVIVYHARNPSEITTNNLYDPGRHTFVKSLNFAVDETPVLNMTNNQELDSQYKNVSVQVVVK
ncbi:MAG: family 43 glycosylhydrolase [Paludibacter sp.]|nr:family 43 glycosylhydrolase [Paludibacter sp.]